MQQFCIFFIIPLLKVLAYVHMIILLLLIQKAQHDPGRNVTNVKIVFQSALNWPNEIPNMSETWWKVIILFLRIHSLTLSSPSSAFAYRWPHHYWIWKATKELQHFSQSDAKFDTDTQQSHMLQPYSKQKMAQHTLSAPSGKVCAAGNSVILWSTQELFDCTMYMLYVYSQTKLSYNYFKQRL